MGPADRLYPALFCLDKGTVSNQSKLCSHHSLQQQRLLLDTALCSFHGLAPRVTDGASMIMPNSNAKCAAWLPDNASLRLAHSPPLHNIVGQSNSGACAQPTLVRSVKHPAWLVAVT